MKLRIRGNTLRLRLTRGEVTQLGAEGRCEETMHLADAWLTYTVVAADGLDAIRAEYSNNTVSVSVPATILQSWAGSDQVSIAGRHGPLEILVEKDFACLKPRAGEDDADTFSHPASTA